MVDGDDEANVVSFTTVIALCNKSSSSNVLGSSWRNSVSISLIRRKSSLVRLSRNKRSMLLVTFGLGSSDADALSALSHDDEAAVLSALAAGVDEAFAVAGAGGTLAYV